MQLGKSIKSKKIIASFTSEENKSIPKLQWVSNNVLARVLMPDGSWIYGISEEAVKKLKVGEVIQFERNFFCRYDGVKKLKGKTIYEFWFGHK